MRTPQRRLLRPRQLTGSQSGRTRSIAAALAALTLGLAGCEVSCENTCEKLLSCDAVETPLVALADCENSCNSQEILYENWDDQNKRQALAAYKSCVSEETCAAIADGACYDEDIYGWSSTEAE